MSKKSETPMENSNEVILENTKDKVPKIFKVIGKNLKNVDETLVDHTERLNKLEGQQSINAIEGGRLDKSITKRATNIVGGYQSNAYRDGQTYSMIARQLRQAVTRRFGVKSAKEVLRKDLEDAEQLVEHWQPSSDISDDIALINAGPRIEKKKSPKLTEKQRKLLDVWLGVMDKHTASSVNRLDQLLSSLDHLSNLNDRSFNQAMDQFDNFVDRIARTERPSKSAEK